VAVVAAALAAVAVYRRARGEGEAADAQLLHQDQGVERGHERVAQVDARIGEFIGAFLNISAEEARVIQKDYYRRYGTSMRGMMTEHGVHADDYLAYVHKIDHSPLEPNPAMGAAIASAAPLDVIAADNGINPPIRISVCHGMAR